MRRGILSIMALAVALLLIAGCGGSSPPPTFTTSILSTHANDGDIELDVANVLHVQQGGLLSVFAGLDTATGSEFRAFLDFPIRGGGGVPSSAFIDAATLDIYIDSYASTASFIPIRIELVSFLPLGLQGPEYDRSLLPPLDFIQTRIFPSDVGHHVLIDVTRLMDTAQAGTLPRLQLRVLEDLGPVVPGLIEIEESIIARAPLLTVTYQ